MPKNCKECKFYGTDVDTAGRCLNHHSDEFGRLVWPSMKACEYAEEKALTITEQIDTSEKRHAI